MLWQWLNLLRKVALIFGVLLTFFAIVELLQAYQILSGVHPYLGYGFIFLILAGIGVGVAATAVGIASQPPVLSAPAITGVESATHKELRRYGTYLARYVTRLSQNTSLSMDLRERCQAEIISLRGALRRGNSRGALFNHLETTEAGVISDALKVLDEEAERAIQTGIRDVMLAVTVSPYRAADLLVVLYRNIAMILSIIRIYRSRPPVREQLLISRDVIRVVATVNFLNFGEKLIEDFMKRLPIVGGIVDDMAQGIGAGLMTSAAGHSAATRCRAYRGWNHDSAAEALHGRLGVFLNDVRRILQDAVLPEVRPRIEKSAPKEIAEQPGFWKNVTQGVSLSVDSVGNTMGNFVAVPASRIAGTAVAGGEKVWSGIVKGGATVAGSVSYVGTSAKGMLNSAAKRLPWPRKKEH